MTSLFSIHILAPKHALTHTHTYYAKDHATLKSSPSPTLTHDVNRNENQPTETGCEGDDMMIEQQDMAGEKHLVG